MSSYFFFFLFSSSAPSTKPQIHCSTNPKPIHRPNCASTRLADQATPHGADTPTLPPTQSRDASTQQRNQPHQLRQTAHKPALRKKKFVPVGRAATQISRGKTHRFGYFGFGSQGKFSGVGFTVRGALWARFLASILLQFTGFQRDKWAMRGKGKAATRDEEIPMVAKFEYELARKRFNDSFARRNLWPEI
ncbi:hypothetical protein TIFTF001_038156 [Ficus carica]|uniref:Uncharacterized protein n=1 Tax=Ficus carica TaxID=3494 RepID=A0AA88JDG3_FICCA|nr:hypothetical protein TIFTF001_038148 [Ficus carica]GMN69098.1 hypothetical protein TIFTF001_038150 [Ficus carica]GMN69103.1 hypothetical protein TIFTF001_038154 [Ficus carica]GMN69104.1 hypothetical protein TIFTF001_038156 [Ficus carica]